MNAGKYAIHGELGIWHSSWVDLERRCGSHIVFHSLLKNEASKIEGFKHLLTTNFRVDPNTAWTSGTFNKTIFFGTRAQLLQWSTLQTPDGQSSASFHGIAWLMEAPPMEVSTKLRCRSERWVYIYIYIYIARKWTCFVNINGHHIMKIKKNLQEP